MEAFRSNQFATFANKGVAVQDLIKIDSMFSRFDGAINPRPYFPVSFMMRAHSAFRSGVGAVMGGQLLESQALFRLCLEHAAYGFYIGGDKDRMERWLGRGESESNRRAVRKEFHNDKIREHIGSAAPVMRAQFERLYDQLIDFGAHPNQQGYLLNTTLTKNDAGDRTFETVYLQADGIGLDMGLKVAGQVGLWALHLMQLLYPERFELLGIRADLEELRPRF